MVASKKQLLVFGGFHENSRLVAEQCAEKPAKKTTIIIEKEKESWSEDILLQQSALGKPKPDLITVISRLERI